MIIPFKPVEIGDITITFKRGTLVAFPGECQHRKLRAEENGEILICLDCDKQISAWWALMRFSRQVSDWKDNMDSRAKSLADAEARGVILLAAQVVEKAWRRRKMVPVCPHCKNPILPTDGFGRMNVRKLHAVRSPVDKPHQ